MHCHLLTLFYAAHSCVFEKGRIIDVNNSIKQLRTERKWSQEDFAEKLGVSRQTVISIEKGKYDPSLPLAFKIAKLLGDKLENIFTE